MSLRPIPDVNDAALMAKLGRAHTLRNARLDALHHLRDAVTVINASDTREAEGIDMARQALDRLEQLSAIALHED